MSGTETTIAIRKLGVTIPIIALTASTITEAKVKMMDAGMNDYLSKPIVKSELMRVFLKWIPNEKIVKTQQIKEDAKKVPDESHRDFWEIIEQIEGLEVTTGLDRVDGQRDVYEKSLSLMLQEIKKSDKNLIAFLSTGDMENFRIEVHGIKGALANIGAMDLSAKAFELENASRHNDVSFCVDNISSFIEGIIELNMKLKNAFSVININNGPLDIPPELPHILEKLMLAFDDIDLVAIDKEIAGIKALNTTGTLKLKLDQINDAIIMMDYDEAKKQIHQLFM